MDDADRAQGYEEIERASAIQAAKSALTELPDIGYCYYCSEATERGKRFCDNGCRDDWERQEKARARNRGA